MYIHCPHRYSVLVYGRDASTFLQGILTQDMDVLDIGSTCFSAFLNAKGRFLWEMIVHRHSDHIELLVSAKDIEQFLRTLTLYTLRADVRIELNSLPLFFVYDAEGPGIRDPRAVGYGLYYTGSPQAWMGDLVAFEAYEQRRINWGMIDGATDIPFSRGIILEYNWEELGGIAWNKGCYVGQELMARTYYSGVVRKHVVLLHYDKVDVLVEDMVCDGQRLGRLLAQAQGSALMLCAKDMVSVGDSFCTDAGILVKVLPFVGRAEHT